MAGLIKDIGKNLCSKIKYGLCLTNIANFWNLIGHNYQHDIVTMVFSSIIFIDEFQILNYVTYASFEDLSFWSYFMNSVFIGRSGLQLTIFSLFRGLTYKLYCGYYSCFFQKKFANFNFLKNIINSFFYQLLNFCNIWLNDRM